MNDDSVVNSGGGGLDGSHFSVLVVGGGQAGLSVSYWLTARGIGHVVLEKASVAAEWRDRRWDSFCLVTPNWQCRLPGHAYSGDDPHGFMVKDQIVEHVRDYAAKIEAPVVEGVAATRLRVGPDGRFTVATTAGTVTADQVVIATGPYQVPLTPRLAERLPAGLTQLHSADYKRPSALPAGAVLVIGTGQSGCQIAEDLHLAGRQVHLATGSAPRVSRFYRGRDVVDWLDDMGYYRRSIAEFDDADAVRLRANHYVTGRDGGRDIDLRAFARDGMRLYGRLAGIEATKVAFAADLAANLDHADAVARSINDSIDDFIATTGVQAPPGTRYEPVWTPRDIPTEIDLATEGITSVVWATGFGRDHRWIDLPLFDGKGYPTHDRGVTSFPGVYFIGLPWQWTWGSGRFSGVADDAEHIVATIDFVRRRNRTFDMPWIAGTPTSTYPSDDNWIAPRTAA
ncbi:MSMEG_0569 family flavin-dependent oxidoreductase [Kutzneria sp. NPDC052558]|uniref:MSMEG_0569 family flavin-dependent oxidoreductase n=1 Tax=Kutzneria sp. NPDC052558 TaxID=3364121 RepID=UPI0037C9606D